MPPRICNLLKPLAIVIGASCTAAGAFAAASGNAPTGAPVQLAQMAEPGAGMAAIELPDTVKLSEDDVESFMQAASRLRQLGVEADAGGDMNFAQSLATNEKARKIISAAGFTPERLQQVAMSIGMAMLALDTDMEELRQNMAQVEQMKSRMSPEQWAAMQGSMGQAYEMMKRVDQQPAENIELVKRYEDQLRESFDSQ